jgi:hypothetical protein
MKLVLGAVICLLTASIAAGPGREAPERVNVTFQEIDDVLPNPFKGFAPWTGTGTPYYQKMLEKATVPWRLVEPEEGRIDWAFIESGWPSMDGGGRAGLRIAAAYPGGDEPDLPQWLVEKGIPMRPYEIDEKPGLAPDWDDPRFLEAHEELISALGARYDDDPRLGWLDIGSYGFWGEWHVFENEHLAGSQETKAHILQHYFDAFPNTPMVIAFDDDFATRYVVEHGGGIRNDCLGRASSNEWYLKSIRRIDPEILDAAWKGAIITGEFCGGARGAVEGTTVGFDTTLAFVRETHWSWIGPAGGAIEPVDEQHRANLDLLHKTLGYRFVLRAAEHDRAVTLGQVWAMDLTVENVAVAPFYFDWPVDLVFEHTESGETLAATVDVDIRDWLPGSHALPVRISLPDDLATGRYAFRLGIVDPKTGAPGIQFANTGRAEDGRYLISYLEVEQ